MEERILLSEETIPDDPFELFRQWFEFASKNSRLADPNAMCLSTIDHANRPDARMVLLKDFDSTGFVFYTNLTSPKARALSKIPYAALTFYWDPIGRQVRIQGRAQIVSDEEADEYFASRPRGSQIGAWASEQSGTLESRMILENRVKELEQHFAGAPVPRPPHWSGFRVTPESIQFWEGRESRLHDRFLFEKDGERWIATRLYP